MVRFHLLKALNVVYYEKIIGLFIIDRVGEAIKGRGCPCRLIPARPGRFRQGHFTNERTQGPYKHAPSSLAHAKNQEG
jgi:hypothetical protein